MLKSSIIFVLIAAKEISGDSSDTINEHIEPQDIAPNLTLDFNNLVASCNTKNQCDSSHANKNLPLTPLMSECEHEFVFSLSGRIRGLTDRAKESINVLNLGDKEKNNRKLIETRKSIIYAILVGEGVDPDDIIDENDLLELVIEDLLKPDDDHLKPYSPVIVNFLRHWIKGTT